MNRIVGWNALGRVRREMTLLDRYCTPCEKRLPRNQRDDIVAELRDILLSRSKRKRLHTGDVSPTTRSR